VASRGKRALIGCAVGCGALLVLFVALIVGFNVWLNRPGRLLEPQSLLGADTTGYVEWKLRLDDPGTEGFVRRMIEAVQTMPSDELNRLPPWLADWLQAQQRREAEQDILDLLPMVVAWTLRPGAAPGEDLHLVTVGVEKFTNRMAIGDWFLGFVFQRIPEIRVERHGQEKIYAVPIGKERERRVTFFIRQGSLFFTSDLDTARQAVDRLAAAESDAAPRTGLDRLFAAAPEGTLRGALTNSRGEMARIWRLLPLAADVGLDEEAAWGAVQGLTVSGGFQADGSFAATFDLQGPGADWAEEFSEPVGRVLRETLARIDHPLEVTSSAAGDRVRIDVRVSDLSQLAQRWMTHGIELEGAEGRKVRVDW
jgi:hypothetical protein